jgi:hypothetical protein
MAGASETAEQDLVWLLRAGYRVLALESFEEERALRVIERAATQAERAFVTWSLAGGIAGKGAGSLDAGLRELEGLDKPLVLAVLDAQVVLGDPMARRRLRDALPRFGQRRQTVVLLGPVVELPLELEREASRLTLPLPSAEELRRLFERVAHGGKAASLCGGLPHEASLRWLRHPRWAGVSSERGPSAQAHSEDSAWRGFAGASWSR